MVDFHSDRASGNFSVHVDSLSPALAASLADRVITMKLFNSEPVVVVEPNPVLGVHQGDLFVVQSYEAAQRAPSNWRFV